MNRVHFELAKRNGETVAAVSAGAGCDVAFVGEDDLEEMLLVLRTLREFSGGQN